MWFQMASGLIWFHASLYVLKHPDRERQLEALCCQPQWITPLQSTSKHFTNFWSWQSNFTMLYQRASAALWEGFDILITFSFAGLRLQGIAPTPSLSCTLLAVLHPQNPMWHLQKRFPASGLASVFARVDHVDHWTHVLQICKEI